MCCLHHRLLVAGGDQSDLCSPTNPVKWLIWSHEIQENVKRDPYLTVYLNLGNRLHLRVQILVDHPLDFPSDMNENRYGPNDLKANLLHEFSATWRANWIRRLFVSKLVSGSMNRRDGPSVASFLHYTDKGQKYGLSTLWTYFVTKPHWFPGWHCGVEMSGSGKGKVAFYDAYGRPWLSLIITPPGRHSKGKSFFPPVSVGWI